MNVGMILHKTSLLNFKAKVVIKATNTKLTFNYKEVKELSSMVFHLPLTDEFHSPIHLSKFLKDLSLNEASADAMLKNNIAQIPESSEDLNFYEVPLNVPLSVTMEYVLDHDTLPSHPDYLSLAKVYDALPPIEEYHEECSETGRFTLRISGPVADQDTSTVPENSMFYFKYGQTTDIYVKEKDPRTMLVSRLMSELKALFDNSFGYAIDHSSKDIKPTSDLISYVYGEMSRVVFELGKSLQDKEIDKHVAIISPLFTLELLK